MTSTQLMQQLRNMTSPFMGTLIGLLSTMQATIEEQNERLAALEKHCGIEFSSSRTATTLVAAADSMLGVSLDLSVTDQTPASSPIPPQTDTAVITTNSNNNNTGVDSGGSGGGDDESKTPLSPKSGKNNSSNKDDKTGKKGKKGGKDGKDTGKKKMSRLERLQAGRGGSSARSKSATRETSRSRGRGGGASSSSLRGRGGGQDDSKSSESELIESSDADCNIKKLNLIFKTYKDDVIKLTGNGRSCKKLDMQNGNIQFGKEILYETDYESNKIVKYRMIFDTKGSKITSGVGVGMAFIEHFNQWGQRNSGSNNSFHIRGDGKAFVSDGFEITHDSFENGKKTQFIKSEGDLVCIELNLVEFEIKIWNYTLQKQNGNETSEECDKIIAKISDNKKHKKLAFIIYLGGSKSKTLSIHSAQAFYEQ